MQVRVLRGIAGEYGSARRGQVIDVSDFHAQQLIRRGLVTPVLMEAAGTAPARPPERRNGGAVGETTSASSSLPGHRPDRRRSKGSRAKPASSP